MNISRIILLVLTLFLLLLLGGLFFKHLSPAKNITPAATPKMEGSKGKEQVKYPVDYTIVLLGDSMTEALGNTDELTADLKRDYPGKTFQTLNYGFGSTNILSVQDRLEKTTFYGRDFRPITDIDFDVILFESFGNNPLSQFPLDEGLKKQTEALDKAVQTIKSKNPRAKIVFVATIAPSRRDYGLGQVNLSDDVRAKWADERIAYMKNHMDYAKSHNIPLIDIFSASLDKNGEANLDYLSKADYIHPSPTGVVFISKQIADFLYKQKIL